MKENIYSQIQSILSEEKEALLQTALRKESGSLDKDMSRILSTIPESEDSSGQHPLAFSSENGSYFISEPFSPKERLIVLGGGHIAIPFCEFSARCGFHVHVVDDRPDFANTDRFPYAISVICEEFPKAIDALHITRFDYVVVITRGHSYDADCLRALLSGVQPYYLGMIGSRKRSKELLAMLEEEGYDQNRLSQICAPIGLKIGASTPEEIAVSILGEVISYKHLAGTQPAQSSVCGSDLDQAVVQCLAGNHEPKVIATVIETKGSTPRRAGAKMAIRQSGEVIGSIGGGWCEAEAIRIGRRLIGTGEYKIIYLDLTNDVAANEGMACGGTMTVLLEDATEK